MSGRSWPHAAGGAQDSSLLDGKVHEFSLEAADAPKRSYPVTLASGLSGNDRHPDPDLCVREQLVAEA